MNTNFFFYFFFIILSLNELQTKQILTRNTSTKTTYILLIYFFSLYKKKIMDRMRVSRRQRKKNGIETICDAQWNRSSGSGKLYWNIIIRIMYLWHHFLIYMKRLSFVIHPFHNFFLLLFFECFVQFQTFVLTLHTHI